MFAKGASATENSLIAMGDSLIVENNYGYDLVAWNDVIGGGLQIGGDLNKVSSPGVTRSRSGPAARGCRVAWRNTTVRSPSVVPKGDSANGLVYLFENVRDPSGADPWYWTALDARTGRVAWKQLAGPRRALQQPLRRHRDRANPATKRSTLYVGGVGGVMALRDG